MSSYYHYNAHQAHPTPITASAVSHNHHGGRNRRTPRLSVSQNPQAKYRNARAKEMNDAIILMNTFRLKYEAGRSFDLEDDMEFCPALLTQNDMVSIASSASDRSSLASNSPDSSPISQPNQPAHGFSLNSSSPPFVPPTFQTHQSTMKLHQPSATRARNAIPIINPATGITMQSPSPSVSPGRMQSMGRRW